MKQLSDDQLDLKLHIPPGIIDTKLGFFPIIRSI